MLEMLYSKEKDLGVSRKESLAGIPLVSKHVTMHESPEGEMLLVIPRTGGISGWASRVLRVDPPPAKILLDELGSAVWKMIDGKNSVGQIVKKFAQEMGLHKREAETSVVTWIGDLMKRGIVSVAFKRKN